MATRIRFAPPPGGSGGSDVAFPDDTQMTDRDPPTGDAAHKVADVLLPWLANGTLEGDQLAFVEAHLRDCAQCRSELAWLRGLNAACIAASASPQAAGAARRLGSALETPPAALRWRARRARTWTLGVAAAALIAVGSAWIAGAGMQPLYRTLGARDAPAVANASIVVVFDPATTEFELRRIVRSAGARIVDGPTQTNAYVLDVAPAQRQQALAALRGERAVMLAERLDGGATQ